MTIRVLLATLVLAVGCGDEVIGYAVSDTESTVDSEGSDSSDGSGADSSDGTDGSDGTGGVADALPDWVAIGFEETIAVSFDDGRNWSIVPEPETEGDQAREGLTRGPDRIVIVGGATTLVSTDGMSWDVYGDALGYARDVAYGNGRFVSVGLGRRAHSTDAVGWVDARNGESELDFNAITFGDGRFVAIGWNTLGTSVDGETWEMTDLTGPKLYAIAYGNGRFVAVGEEGRVLVTTDGVNIDSDSMQDTFFDGVCFFEGEFVAHGGFVARTSTDAVEWREFAVEPAHALGCGPSTVIGIQDDQLNRGDELLSMEPVQSLGVPLYTTRYTGSLD